VGRTVFQPNQNEQQLETMAPDNRNQDKHFQNMAGQNSSQ